MYVDNSVKRGDIFYADLSPVVGSEQGGVRPVLIVQNDTGNRHSPTVIAAAITSQTGKAKLPTHIPLSALSCGLPKDSIVLLEQIRAFLSEIRSMNLLADEEGLTLNSQEREQLKQLADDYYASLTDADKAYIKASRDDVYTMYEAYHRANKLVDELTKDVSLEISDSEARVIQVQEIAVSEEAKAQEVYEKVVSEGADFAATARKESENSEIDVTVGRGERDDAYESNVFALETGAVTEPFLWRGKWYVVKCVNDFDEDATLERKNNMALERKNKAFRSIYDSFEAEHKVEIEGSIWNKVSLSDGADCTTSDFFERYHEVMGE